MAEPQHGQYLVPSAVIPPPATEPPTPPPPPSGATTGGPHAAQMNYDLGYARVLAKADARIAALIKRAERAEAAEADLRQHILDIDAHATPSGDIPDEPGWVGTYLLTAGALHRALGKIGHSAPKCQAEEDLRLTQQAFEEYRASWSKATEATLAEVERLRAAIERVRALHVRVDRGAPTPHACGACLAGYDRLTGELVYAAWPCPTIAVLDSTDPPASDPHRIAGIFAAMESGQSQAQVWLEREGRWADVDLPAFTREHRCPVDGSRTLRARDLAELLDGISDGMDEADLSAIRERITAEKTILATLGLCERCGYPLDWDLLAPHPEADRG